MNGLKNLFIGAVALFIFTFSCCSGIAQTIDSTGIVRVADFRNKSADTGLMAAFTASRRAIVVLTRGGNEELVESVTGQLKALVQQGYVQILGKEKS